MLIDPNEDIDERFKKLRQANFKLEYKQRMGSGGRRRGAGRARVRASAGARPRPTTQTMTATWTKEMAGLA